MTPRIGATSYVFRYLLSDASKAPTLDDLLCLAADAGLDSFQICENARPLNASAAEWNRLGRQSASHSLHLSLGCMTLDPRVIVQYLDRVEAIGGSYLRVVLERQGEAPLNLDGIRMFLDKIIAELEARKICLAIENHFEIPSRVLAEAARDYPSNLVGFCVDVANSLRNFEDASVALDLLGSRAICYHLKDYVVAGSNVGFNVSGAPFGEGRIGALSLVRRLLHGVDFFPQMFLETWTPASGVWADDVARDAQWLSASMRNLKQLLSDVIASPLPPTDSTQK
jgi:sugar phosphate isomerase/epimerase